MKMKSLFWSLTAASVMLFASCINDEVPGTDNSVADGKTATVEVTIATTRAASGTLPGVGDESKITNIEAYTFSTAAAPNDTLIGYAAGTTATRVTLKGQVGSTVIALVANSSIGTVATLSELKKELSTFTFTKLNSTSVPSEGFVMSSLNTKTLVEGTNTFTLPVDRTVSRFNEPTFTPPSGTNLENFTNVDTTIVKDVFPTFIVGTDDVADIKFTYQAYALANGLDKTLLFNDADYFSNEWPTDKTEWIPGKIQYLNSTFTPTGFYPSATAAEGVYSGDFINVPVYVHENFPYITTDVNSGVDGYEATEVYCFIVEGVLTFNQNTATRYWRVNLVRNTSGLPNNNDYYKIFRNGLYNVNIDQVRTLGHPTPEDAEKETPIIPGEGETSVVITVSSAPWDLYQSATQM